MLNEGGGSQLKNNTPHYEIVLWLFAMWLCSSALTLFNQGSLFSLSDARLAHPHTQSLKKQPKRGILIIVQVRGKPKLVLPNVNVKRKTQKFQISRAEKKTSLHSAMICQHEERLHCHSCKFLWIANIYEHQIFLKLDAFYLLRRRFHIAQVLELLQAWCTIYDPCEALIVFDRVNKCWW